jgi:pimeloyl-ACP methyl ester carboxylesterase
LGAGGPPTHILEQIRPDAHGFIKLTRVGVDEVFAQDLSREERAVIFATQSPLAGAAFGGQITTPAWKQKPSFYLRATEDRTIHPDLQQTMATRINAKRLATVASSHLPMLSHPRVVADFIIAAAD